MKKIHTLTQIDKLPLMQPIMTKFILFSRIMNHLSKLTDHMQGHRQPSMSSRLKVLRAYSPATEQES